MIPLLSVAEFAGMLSRQAVLPIDPNSETGALDEARITEALKVATGVIVAHLPWMLDTVAGEITLPLPAQFGDSLRGVCADIALIRLTDAVTSKEDDQKRYAQSIDLLKTIAKEHQGGLLGPEYQAAELVEADETLGIGDNRFWKKGEVI